MIPRRLALVSVVAAIVWPATASAAPPLPSRMAAIGDSITKAADVCCWYGDHPHESWSTGDNPLDGIRSHYERILALKPGILGRNYNDAESGAKMNDAPAQAGAAVSQRAKYVTILMGGNDVCTGSISTMTSVETFRGEFSTTMQTLASGLPAGSHVFVSSIPNIHLLWDLFHDDPVATLVWSNFHICQSMLAATNTEEDRQAVLAREVAFNQVLADVCGQYTMCRFDGNAIFDNQFSKSDVSKLDYFHPSLSGQATLASVTWQRSWWGS